MYCRSAGAKIVIPDSCMRQHWQTPKCEIYIPGVPRSYLERPHATQIHRKTHKAPFPFNFSNAA